MLLNSFSIQNIEEEKAWNPSWKHSYFLHKNTCSQNILIRRKASFVPDVLPAIAMFQKKIRSSQREF